MTKKKVYIAEGQVAVGPYSHAAEANGFIFVAGTGPVDGSNVEMKDVKKATAMVLDNVRKVLKTAGSDLDRVVKVNVYLRDMADFSAMNEAYAPYFPKDPPARTCVAVKQLPFDIPVEIEAIAVR